MKKIYVVFSLLLTLFAAKGYAQETETPLWTAEGSYVYNYYAETPQFTGTATIEAYADNRYVVKNFMKAGGGNLEFTAVDGVVSVTNGANGTADATYVYNVSGADAADAIYLYMGASYCPDYTGFSGDATGGELYLGAYYYPNVNESIYTWGTYDLVWGSAGIQSIKENKTATQSKGMYNLQGCRVADGAALTSGMYILDGKKILVK
ncbi:MAG: hypothetical protein ACI4BA_07965 [Prevotella sp.]